MTDKELFDDMIALAKSKANNLGYLPGSLNEKIYVEGFMAALQVEHTNSAHRDYNVGNSDYAKHTIQPWDIWKEYHLNPWDADIVKRILRTKEENGMTPQEARKMDYEKIIHICQERINHLDSNYEF